MTPTPSGAWRLLRYITNMDRQAHRFKYIVTALCVTVAAWAPASADTLDDLFADLAQADETTAPRIERQITAEWEKSGSASFDLLMRRGKEALADGDPEAALDHFSALVDHAPDFGAAYGGRSAAYYALGLTGPALDDLRQSLVLNPRNFDAMRGVAVILENLERPADALEVYQTILDLHPSQPEARAATARLKLQLEGQAI